MPDLAVLASWMTAQDGVRASCTNALRLDAGSQNIMIMFERNGLRYVLRQPPASAIYPPQKMVGREVRVLNALDGSGVPHPRVFGSDTGETLGSAFYVMSAVDGFTATQGLPVAISKSASLQRRLGFSAVETLVALSRVDHIAAGLGDLGKPQGFLDRQVSRWRAQLDSYTGFAGWSLEGAFLGVDAIGQWLAAHLPVARAPGLLHGDYHLGNLIFGHADAEVVSVIDWELATVGDPLVDLGWLIATWPESDGSDSGAGVAVPAASSLPSPAELIEYYAKLSGDRLEDIGWYVVLACYKLGILQEGSWARALAGKADSRMGQIQHERAQALIEKAANMISAPGGFGL